MKLKFLFLILALVGIASTAGYIIGKAGKNGSVLTPASFINPRPFGKYTIDSLSKIEIKGSRIEVGEKLSDFANFSSYIFSFSVDPDFDGRIFKKVTGQLNLPRGEGPYPLIVMFRGYVDQKTYTTGTGTKKAGEYFANNGFITIAPDFLGYGGSDHEAENIFESRFQTYVTALSLLQSLNSLDAWDQKNVFIWGHSNGGQIAITVLEITQKPFPTTLWAPVSKPFPYSVLYYTDESDDKGKLIRGELAKFEDEYDTDLYSTDGYFDRIKAPIQLHQGTADDAVPPSWSNNLAKILSSLNVDLEYYTYLGADHNLNPSWNAVVARDVAFFKKHAQIVDSR